MNGQLREMLRYVCRGELRNAQAFAKRILESSTAKADQHFCREMLGILEARKTLLPLPYNLKDLLIAEDVSGFPEKRYLLRPLENDIFAQTVRIWNAAEKLAQRGVAYTSTRLLYGESGTGKTMLAKYIAYKLGLPFVYVNLSSSISSLMGSTGSNIAKIVEYARTTSCVLCFDEIDALGMARGQKNDVGEMNRVVLALMQQLDLVGNDVLVIGTTNRYDRLDAALVRRFSLHKEVTALNWQEVREAAEKFFVETAPELTDEHREQLIIDSIFYEEAQIAKSEGDGAVHIPAAKAIGRCVQALVELVS